MAPSVGRLALGPQHHRCQRDGPVKTPSFISEDSVVEDVMLATTAIKRLVEPEEVAGLACCLVSEGAIR